jgi:ABC-type sulfate transport system permease component
MSGWKTAFPEASSAIIFLVCYASYAFIDDFHKPTYVHLTPTPEGVLV